MDAFYASVEQRDFPALRGKPLAVGGSPDGRGVVATASYEARKYGVKSAMPSRQALQLCPELIFTHPRFDVYKEVSQQIRQIFLRYTDLIEPLSLDEAYLDVTEDKQGIGSAIDIAKQIKKEIQEELNLTVSAGVSVNKFVAKIASDMNKPDGLTFIGPSKVVVFMERLPIEKFFGVGKVTASKMKKLGIHTGADMKQWTEEALLRHFGKTGKFFYNIVRGIDNRPVQPNRQTKSISVEDTFAQDIADIQFLEDILKELSARLVKRLNAKELTGKTVTLKVKFSDFTQATRSMTFLKAVTGEEALYQIAAELLNKVSLIEMKVRLLGVGVSNFTGEDPDQQLNRQLTLF
ncbi:DNA polymerase IV [Sphingobacterium spiritivorum]|uniref:DNA polymerase IV n=1 Tax=Sphingobacterium spiritivorum TaxID=258 RepID=UPI001F2B6A8C|nr:DNA polymerase IV [Sphingobacterium spiritivorum]